jgi:tetratricopeptide (TPR) repeat protein
VRLAVKASLKSLKTKTGLLLILALAISMAFVPLGPLQVQAQPAQYPVNEKQRAELTIRSAETALSKAESFINYAKTTLSKANATELAKEALDNATALLDKAKSLLDDAKACFDQGAYENVTLKAMEAMRLCREAYRMLHNALEEKGLVKPERPEMPEVKGRGILVAVNRSLERIERLEGLIEELKAVLPQIEGNLTKARELLNATEIRQLLVAGNVSEAAKRLAEAEKLIGQAYGLLHSAAKAKVAQRIEKYKSKVLEKLEELGKAVNATVLGEALKGLGLKNFEELKKLVEDHVDKAKEEAKAGIEKVLQKLKEVRDKLEELRKSLPRPPKPTPPIVKPPVEIFLPTPTPPTPPKSYEAKLSVKAEATREGGHAIVKVVVENAGNVTIIFSNAALNLVIEKNVNGKWILYYSPISAQVITKLGSGEFKTISLKMKAEPGLYRAVVRGLAEGTMQPVMGSAEFTIR